MPRCSHCGRDNPDGFAFCPGCGQPLTPTREVRKVVTVLFCDLVGSTSLGEQTDPEALRVLLKRYYSGARSVIERHGGLVEKFVGDAVMAVFGLPVAREDDAVRAVRAAIELHEVVGELSLQVRIGINTGQVVAGAGDTLVTGDTVNTAARLEQAADAGATLLGHDTQQLASDLVTTEPVEVAAKGKRDPVRAHRVTGLRPASAVTAQLPLIGRLAEREALREVYDDVVAAGRCRLVTVVGAPGIGKSRLVAQMVEEIAGDAQVVSGRAVAYGEGMTYGPLAEILQQLGTPPDSVIQRSAADTIVATQAVIEAAAAKRTLVVVLDDLHWAEPAFLRLVTAVALGARGPVLLLCLARPELDTTYETWSHDVPDALRLDLAALSPEDAGLVLSDALRGDAAAGVVGRILDAADGNPLYLVQMAQHAALDRAASVPPTIEALLTSRLDALDEAARTTLEAAAVEGETFHAGSVSTLVGRSPPEVEMVLAELARLQFVRPDRTQIPGESGYRFSHLLLRDATYDSLTKAARASLHESHAGWLVASDGVLERDELVGHHLEAAAGLLRDLDPADANAAALADRAGRHLADAGIRAAERDDSRAAINLMSRARGLLADPAARRELIRYLFIAEYATEWGGESIAPLLSELREGSEADQAMADVITFHDEDDIGLDDVEAAGSPLLESGDPLAVALWRQARVSVLWNDGSGEEAVSEAMAAFRDLRRAGISLFATDIVVDVLFYSALRLSAPDRQRLIDELRATSNDLGRVFEATVDSHEARVRYLAGEIGAEDFDRLVGCEEEVCAQTGREIDQALAREVRTVLGPWCERDLEGTERSALEALELEVKWGSPGWRIDLLEGSWAHALCDVGSFAVALDLISRADDRIPPFRNAITAWACAGLGDADGARRALALLGPDELRPVVPRFDSRYISGRTLALLGDAEGAHAALSEYIDFYAEIGYHRIANRARMDLAAMQF